MPPCPCSCSLLRISFPISKMHPKTDRKGNIHHTTRDLALLLLTQNLKLKQCLMGNLFQCLLIPSLTSYWYHSYAPRNLPSGCQQGCPLTPKCHWKRCHIHLLIYFKQETRYAKKKSIRHLCILKLTNKISWTFLVTIIRHKARNIAKQANTQYSIYFYEMYDFGTNQIFSIYVYFPLKFMIIKQS